MDITTIAQLIGTLGFPVVASVAMFWLVVKNNDTIEKLRGTLEENTRLLHNLLLLIGREDKDK